jgi:hypothetical protein
MSFENIPIELRQLPQWVCWRFEDRGGEKPTKVPYNPRNNHQASVIDPNHWATFDEACKAVQAGWFDGIGFVFTDNDPFAFVDLDDTKGDAALYERQQQIYKDFDSYSEVSPSGKGCHIIIRGKIPSGRKRNAIEIYSNGRYATFTGQVIAPKPIEDRNTLLNALYERMGAGVAVYQFDGTAEEKETDTAIIDKASRAINGEKFKKLLTGDWSEYPSQSEADLAFVDIIAFYTQNSGQITRIFRACPLGQRLKANRDSYIQYMLNKCFDRMLPQLDFDGLRNAVEAKIAEDARNSEQLEMFAAQQRHGPKSLPGLDIVPPGLVGELARFMYQASPRPIPEIALAGALGFMAGIVGRAYNVSGDGLNQYIMVISPTGTGKEAISRGINRIINSIRAQVPTALEFIGPGEIRSDAALLRTLSKTPCFVSIIGEFAEFMRNISDPRATASLRGIRKLLRDLYHKSGANQTQQATVYSDKDKNIDPIYSPNFTILGEGNPEEFYSSLNEAMISGGLLPRFLLIEYHGKVPPLNKGFENVAPPFQLLEQVAAICALCQSQMHSKKVTTVVRNTEAESHFDQFEKFTTHHLNNANKDVFRQLWNRAHIKSMKLAALIAVGINPYDPIITIESAKWATDIVAGDVMNIIRRFEIGDVGGDTEESKQIAELCKIMRNYLVSPFGDIANYGVSGQMHNEKVIPWTFLSRKLVAVAAFRNDRIGATSSLKRAVQTLLDSGDIREVPKGDLSSKFGYTGRAFMVANVEILEA